MLGLLNILLVAFPLLFGSVSAADEPQGDSYTCCEHQTSGSHSIEDDATCHCDCFLRGRVVTASFISRLRTAVQTANCTYKKIQTWTPSVLSAIKDENSLNINTWDDYLERLSRHTSGMRASVDRLFTLGSVRL